MWQQMREVVKRNFPAAPGIRADHVSYTDFKLKRIRFPYDFRT